MITVAPEAISVEDVAYLHSEGIIVSIGHSNVNYETTMRYFDSGVSAVTHLYNAMSGLAGRDPGVIGAVLNHPNCYAAIIPDLYHVHHANVEMAAKVKPDHLFFVTDCHAPAGSDLKEFNLTGRHMCVAEGRCVDEKGTLCGSIILMDDGLRNGVRGCNIPLERALKMATLTPAKAMRLERQTGSIRPGLPVEHLITIRTKDFKCRIIET
jgi:N-acetylglucosamine-6-phosphate deacetylase